MNSSTTELAQPSISFYVCISQAAPLLSSNTNTIMRLWRIHSGGEKNAKNNEIVKRQQQQQAAANNPRVFGRTSRKERKQSYSVVREPVRVPGTYHMKDTFDNQPRTNLRRGLRQKAVTTRDRCVAHMLLRSCRDVRRPRHFFCPTQNLPLLSNLIQMEPRKPNIVLPYFGGPQTGEVY